MKKNSYKYWEYILVLIIPLFYINCNPFHRKTRIIVLQPIGHYDLQEIGFIQQQVNGFFKMPVIVRNETAMPLSFLNTTKGERYSADSIIKWLSHSTTDSIISIVGLTHEDIFTTITDSGGHIKEPTYKYAVWGIFGLGYCPGKSSVMSDYRLKTNDIKKFQHRLRTIVIHEIGHNLGLPHCKEKNCIMNDANERIQTVDNSAENYCNHCKNRIKSTW
jgi:archaemetzincin